MVSLVGNEVREHVSDVERQISPHVSLGHWDFAFGSESELEKGLHPRTTPLQRRHELPWRHPAMVDARGRRNPVLATEGLEPTAAGVVEVSGNRADRAPRHVGNRELPEGGWQTLDELGGDAVVRSPGAEYAGPQITWCRHVGSSESPRFPKACDPEAIVVQSHRAPALRGSLRWL